MPGMTFEHGLELWKLILEFVKALAWPLSVLIILAIFRSNIRQMLSSLRKAELPWIGGSVEFEREVANLSVEANQPDEEKLARQPAKVVEGAIANYNAAVVARGLQPTRSGLDLNYFRKLAADDPNLSLAALRMEIETVLSNLAQGFGVPAGHKFSPRQTLDLLKDAGAITTLQHRTAQKVIDLCNRAIHGQAVDSATALTVIDSVKPLIDDYKSWLSWGFPEFADQQAA